MQQKMQGSVSAFFQSKKHTNQMYERRISMNTYTQKERSSYLVGLSGQSVIYAVSYILAYYFQFTLLIPAAAVSAILTANQIWDAFKDPVMGSVIDRTRSKWGKARPWLLFAPLPIGVFTILCYVNGIYDPTQGMAGRNLLIAVWAATAYFFWGLAYTAGDIPLQSLPALMTEDQGDRTKLISMKTIAAMAGFIFGMAIQPMALHAGQAFAEQAFAGGARGAQESERLGFISVVIPVTLIAAALLQLAGLFTKERVALTEKTYSFKETLLVMWCNKPYRAVLLSGLLASPKSAEGLATMPFASYYYANKDPGRVVLYGLLLSAGSFIGKVVAVKLTPMLTARYEKSKLYNFANLMIAPSTLFVFLLYLSAPTRMAEPFYLVLTALAFTVAGTFHGIVGIVTPLLVADAVDCEEYHNKVRPDGVFASGQTMIGKIDAGISSLIGGAVYSVSGFSGERVEALNRYIDAGGMARLNPNFQPYMTALFFLMTAPTVIGALLSVLPTWRYPLRDEEHVRMLEELRRRRHDS